MLMNVLRFIDRYGFIVASVLKAVMVSMVVGSVFYLMVLLNVIDISIVEGVFDFDLGETILKTLSNIFRLGGK